MTKAAEIQRLQIAENRVFGKRKADSFFESAFSYFVKYT